MLRVVPTQDRETVRNGAKEKQPHSCTQPLCDAIFQMIPQSVGGPGLGEYTALKLRIQPAVGTHYTCVTASLIDNH